MGKGTRTDGRLVQAHRRATPGVFELRELAGGTRRNPKTGAAIEVPAKRSVRCKTGKGLSQVINQPTAEQQKGAHLRG